MNTIINIKNDVILPMTSFSPKMDVILEENRQNDVISVQNDVISQNDVIFKI